MRLIKSAKILAALFLALLCLSSFGYAAQNPITQPDTIFESYTKSIDMNTRGVSEVIDIIANTASQENITLVLTAGVENLEVWLNDERIECQINHEVARTVIYCPFGRQIVGRYSLRLEFESSYPVISLDSRLMFKSTYAQPFPTQQFTLILKLPLGYVITDPTIYVTPSADRIYSDGQRHIVLWQRADLKEAFDTSVISEPVAMPPDYTPAILILITIGVVIVYYVRMQKKKAFRKLVYPHLIESEKAVIDALEANLGVLKQKDLQKITSFSKAKLSRVLKNLEQRGLIEKKPWGNTFKVFLIKKRKKTKGK